MLKRFLRLAIIASINLAFLSYITAIMLENRQNIFVFSLALLCLAILLYSIIYHRKAIHLPAFRWGAAASLWAVPTGAVLVYFLNNTFHLGPALSAGMVGLGASFIPNIGPKKSNISTFIPGAIYCGAFVGMTHEQVAGGYTLILLASGVAALLLMLTNDILTGFGGKLGAIAFASVSIVSLMFSQFLK